MSDEQVAKMWFNIECHRQAIAGLGRATDKNWIVLAWGLEEGTDGWVDRKWEVIINGCRGFEMTKMF